MATISGKRFQITDGASSLTNLFPYTVTEAVYGLSTVLANTQSAAVTAAATSAASLYVPLTRTVNSKALSSNITLSLDDVADGSTRKLANYLPMTGGTLWNNTRNFLRLSTTDANGPYIEFQINNNVKGYVGYYEATGVASTWLGAGSNRLFLDTAAASLRVGTDATNYTVYHSGNSNKSDVAWACSTLTASGGVISRALKTGTYSSVARGSQVTGGLTDDDIAIYSYTGSAMGKIYAYCSTFYVAGNMGIGNASPEYKLDVNGSAAFGTSSGCNIYLRRGDANYFTASATGGFFIWQVNGSTTQAMRLTPSGNLMVGAGTDDNYKVFVSGSVACSTINITGGGAYPRGICFEGLQYRSLYGIETNAPGTNYPTHGDVTGDYAMFFNMSGAVHRGFIFRRGDTNTSVASISIQGILTTSGDQVISSDINLKTNLQDVTYSVEDIAKTRAVTFDWKDGRGKSAGSIAQDWKPLIPELVHGEEGNMTLAYGQIALVNSILLAKHETEQDKEIARLKARVKELETRLNIS